MKNYISIQKFRFRDVFDFFVKTDKSVDMKILVPKMLIQTFVENAIYHGLVPKKKEGILTIDVLSDSEYLVIKVKDNGIGRNAKLKPYKSTGRGIEMMQNYIDLLNRNNPKKLTFSIADLEENGKPSGTEVTIKIPENYYYS